MAQQPLHGREVGSVVEHIGGATVAQHMRRASGRGDTPVEHGVYRFVHQAIVHRLASGTDEKFARSGAGYSSVA